MLRIAINGFGRIGRMVLRAIYENNIKGLKVVAINNRAKPETSAFLLERDTVHGKFNQSIKYTKNEIIIGKDKIQCYHESDPINCPWDDEKVDIVLECTGKFNSKDESYKHIEAGAKKVIVSAPCADADQTVVYGVNHKNISKKDHIISVASCTTNCLAPLAFVIHKNFKIEKGYMTTIHSYTTDQRLLDNSHKDLRRARSAPNAMVPTSTGAAKSLKMIIPDLDKKIDGISIRVPTPNVSLIDLTFVSKKEVSIESINDAMSKASEGNLKGILSTNSAPLVSKDFNHNPHSSIFDLTQTQVIKGKFSRVLSWYDNEWGFSNRMCDTAIQIAGFI